MNLLHVGVIGAGKWGKNHIRILNERSILVGIADKDPKETAAFLANTYPSIKVMGDYQELLDNQSIDRIVVATPIETHFKIAKASLEKGKHTLVEKPLALKSSEIEELYSIASERALVLFTGYLYLYDEKLREIKAVIKSNPDNWIYEATWKKWGTFDSPITTNLLVHDIALATKLLGAPVELLSVSKNPHSSDTISVELSHEHGVSKIHIDRTSKNVKERKTTLTNGNIQFSFSPMENLLDAELDAFLKESDHQANAKRREIDLAVINALRMLGD